MNYNTNRKSESRWHGDGMTTDKTTAIHEENIMTNSKDKEVEISKQWNELINAKNKITNNIIVLIIKYIWLF